MNCRKVQEWISADLDGELDAGRKAKLTAHLTACVSCRELRVQWLAVGRQLRAEVVPQVQTPEAAWADVRRAIRNAAPEAAEETSWQPIFRLRWASIAAAVVVAAGLLSIVVLRRPSAPEVAAAPQGSRVEWVETGLPGASPMVYEDEESGMVIIWVVEANNKEGGHAGS
jgi:anti-sigma factor RsiW